MTTDSPRTRQPGARVLLGAGVAGLVVVALVVLVAALVHGGDAALAAAVGGGAAVVVFAFGTTVVHVVSAVSPAASLLVALMTYALQLAALALLVVAISDASFVRSDQARAWFAVGVIVATIGWMAAQIVRATRLRLPAYEAGAR